MSPSSECLQGAEICGFYFVFSFLCGFELPPRMYHRNKIKLVQCSSDGGSFCNSNDDNHNNDDDNAETGGMTHRTKHCLAI